MKLDLDLSSYAQQLQATQRQRPARERAIAVLQDVVAPDMSLEALIAYCLVLSEQHEHVRESLRDIQLSDVLAQTPSKPAPKRRAKRVVAEQHSAEAQALIDAVTQATTPLSKSELIAAALDAQPALDKAAVARAFRTVRRSFKALGKGPGAKYTSEN